MTKQILIDRDVVERVIEAHGHFKYLLNEALKHAPGHRLVIQGGGIIEMPVAELRAALAQTEQPAQGELPSLPSPVELNHASNSVMGYHEAHLKEYARAALLQSNAERVPLSDAQWQEVAMLVGCEVIAPRGRAAFSRIFGIKKGQQ
jgi:hypothetical protein